MVKTTKFYLTVLMLGVIASLVFVWTVQWDKSHAKPRITEEMSVAMPAVLQLGFALGDRFLAANAGVFRSQTVGTHDLKKDTYHALAKVQLSSAQLNPRHEDNYYTAAAILSWTDQLDIAQQILTYATDARFNDALPPFFRGFNKYHFLHDLRGAGKDLLIAADRSGGGNASGLRGIAAHWIERGYEPIEARRIILAMASNSNNPHLTARLNARAARLEGLIALQDAANKYTQKTGEELTDLNTLVRIKLIDVIPVDPMGIGYVLDDKGIPQLAKKAK